MDNSFQSQMKFKWSELEFACKSQVHKGFSDHAQPVMLPPTLLSFSLSSSLMAGIILRVMEP